MALTGPLITVPGAPEGITLMTPKFVPGPVRILTAAVVFTALPGAHPLDVVAVWVGVPVALAVLVGTVAVAVPVAVGELVIEGVRVIVGVFVIDGVVVAVRVPVAVREAEAVAVGVAVPVAVTNSAATQPLPKLVETGRKS